jgi:hypothetical protein
MQEQDVEHVLQHLLQDSKEEATAVHHLFIQAYISAVQCGVCLESLMAVLVQQPARASLSLPADIFALEQIVGIAKAAASEPIDSSGVAASPTSAAELTLCAVKPGALLHPAHHTSSVHTVSLMLEELTQSRERAVKLSDVGADPPAPGAEAWASADAAVREWLLQITVTLQAASSTASMAFLTGSAADCAQLAEATSSLWARYQEAIDKLHLSCYFTACCCEGSADFALRSVGWTA